MLATRIHEGQHTTRIPRRRSEMQKTVTVDLRPDCRVSKDGGANDDAFAIKKVQIYGPLPMMGCKLPRHTIHTTPDVGSTEYCSFRTEVLLFTFVRLTYFWLGYSGMLLHHGAKPVAECSVNWLERRVLMTAQ